MSRTPFFYIEKLNKDTGKYEMVHLFRKPGKYSTTKKEYEEVDIWPWNGTHEVFRALGAEYGSYYGGINGIQSGIPTDISSELSSIVEEHKKDGPLIFYVTLADLYIDYLQNPTVVDFEDDWEDETDPSKAPRKENPIKSVIDRIETVVKLADDCLDIEEYRSYIRLVYWVY